MTLHQFSIRLRQGRKLGVLRNTRPQRISFPRFSTPSFPFCSIPKTENSELRTSEFSRRFTRTTIFFTKLCNSGGGGGRCNFTHFDQTPSFLTPRFRFCAIPQTENSAGWKTSEVDQSTSPSSRFWQ